MKSYVKVSNFAIKVNFSVFQKNLVLQVIPSIYTVLVFTVGFSRLQIWFSATLSLWKVWETMHMFPKYQIFLTLHNYHNGNLHYAIWSLRYISWKLWEQMKHVNSKSRVMDLRQTTKPLSNCNRISTDNHLVCKQTLNHFSQTG